MREGNENNKPHLCVPTLDGISGYVHVGCVEIGSIMREDSPCFDSEFGHKW